MSKWIPVSKRLPEDGSDVLVRYRYGHKTVCVVAYRVSGNDCWTMSVGDCFDFPDEQATHWMPLPEPPITDEVRALHDVAREIAKAKGPKQTLGDFLMRRPGPPEVK